MIHVGNTWHDDFRKSFILENNLKLVDYIAKEKALNLSLNLYCNSEYSIGKTMSKVKATLVRVILPWASFGFYF